MISTVSRMISFCTLGFGVGRGDAVVEEDEVCLDGPFHKAGDLVKYYVGSLENVVRKLERQDIL